MNETKIPNGHYNVTVMDHCLAVSKNGKQSVKIKFQVHDSIEDAGESLGAVIYLDLYLSEKALPYTVDSLAKTLDCTDWTRKSLNEGEILRDKECIAHILNEEYEGKINPKIHYITKTLGMTRAEDEELGAYDTVEKEMQAYARQKGYGTTDKMPI